MSTEASTLENYQGSAVAISLTVKDLTKSLEWYSHVLGFTIERKIERDGILRGVALRAGEVRISINQDDGKKGWERVKGEGFSFRIMLARPVDEIAERIKKSGGVLDSEPADMTWGVRLFRLKDPDGYKISFSTALPAKV